MVFRSYFVAEDLVLNRIFDKKVVWPDSFVRKCSLRTLLSYQLHNLVFFSMGTAQGRSSSSSTLISIRMLLIVHIHCFRPFADLSAPLPLPSFSSGSFYNLNHIRMWMLTAGFRLHTRMVRCVVVLLSILSHSPDLCFPFLDSRFVFNPLNTRVCMRVWFRPPRSIFVLAGLLENPRVSFISFRFAVDQSSNEHSTARRIRLVFQSVPRRLLTSLVSLLIFNTANTKTIFTSYS